ncbi:MAG TPA: hypothetical protein VID28_03040 [Methylomirabilota bacterium]|jgi:hypothetical protein
MMKPISDSLFDLGPLPLEASPAAATAAASIVEDVLGNDQGEHSKGKSGREQ